jgi:integrase
MWRAFLDWAGLRTTDEVTPSIPVALIIARCCPPIGLELPPFLSRRVAPVTAAADIDTLRRAATLGVEGMERSLKALADHRVLALQKAIGGRARRLTTAKRPVLFHEILGFWTRSKADYHTAASHSDTTRAFNIARDAFAVVLSFAAATRVSEILNLRGEHIQVDKDDVLIVTFESVKNRRTLFTTHQPFKIALNLPILLQAFDLFNRVCGFADGLHVFHRSNGRSRDKLSRDWFCGIIKGINPDCSPHSVRVGAATELHAAGVPISAIMALGRWTSAAAVIYILGCLDVTIEASTKLGTADLRFVRGDLRTRPGVCEPLRPWTVTRDDTTSSDQWLQHCASIEDVDG